ncbi:integrase catalytic domain-containing protein [Trichonephila clavipes]|uniref:Integrase catalytic domain-containing protein n=1 Tax=Trichonephila clavipes TaxID=2585209 RepID=A0A8X6SQX5_TRICX|nr:integrase catalytic domain-containing protein [Trichonephila clavipes]
MTDPVSLPSDRVKDTAVFEVVGVDLAGPLYVKRGDKLPGGEACENGERASQENLREDHIYVRRIAILCECEKLVNSRPLTYRSEDMQDLTPITPARFLFEIPTADTKDLNVRDANPFRKRLKFRAKVQQTDSFVSYPNPDTLKATEKPQVTRCGRTVKKLDKLNLLTLTDVFDLAIQLIKKGGGMML